MACDLPLSCVTGDGADYCGCSCPYCCQDPCCDSYSVHLAAGFNGTPSECPEKAVCDGILDGTPFMFKNKSFLPLNLLYLTEKEFIFNPENNILKSEELKITNKINNDYVFSLDLCEDCCDCDWTCNEYDIIVTTDGCCFEEPITSITASAFSVTVWGNTGSTVSWTPSSGLELCCHEYEILANGVSGGSYTTVEDCELVLFTLSCTDDPCDGTTQSCPDIAYAETIRCCSIAFTEYQCIEEHDWGGGGAFRFGPKYKISKNPKILIKNLLNRQSKIIRKKFNQ